MYSREVEGDVRTFGVSGKLWHGVMVMFDRATGTLWTQLDGRAIQGEELGARLAHYPSTFTTWEKWKREHPDTLALAKPEDERERTGSRYADYFEDPDRLWMDHLADDLGGIRPKDVVYGVLVDGEALAVSEAVLSRRGVVNAVVAGTPVAFLRSETSDAVVAVDRRLGERVLVLEPFKGEDPHVRFRDTGSGEVHGPDELKTLRVDRAYWYAWSRSHRGSRVLAD